MNYILETRNLTKTYGRTTVVDRMDLHIPKGKIYGLLGRNGAGKTTAMKMMLQLIKPSVGKVYLFGTKQKEENKNNYHRVGSIIESPGFYENLNGYDNLEILSSLRGRKGSAKHKEVEQALEVVGLQNEYKKPYSAYSLGMKQRLGIAAAIMHDPELLILDEPINGLDPIGIAQIRKLLVAMSRERGTTILISSHVLNEIERIADYIGVLNQGKLIEEIDMEEWHRNNIRYTELGTSDTEYARNLLKEERNIIRCEGSGDILRVYDQKISAGELNQILVEHGLNVWKVDTCQESLEEYFSSRIGGDEIA